VSPAALLEALAARGVELAVTDGRLRCRPAGRLTPELRAALVEHKPALLRLLATRPCVPLSPGVDGYCPIHARHLTHGEFTASVCWWGAPERAPSGHKARGLTADELERLIVYVPGAGLSHDDGNN
jgi:hypothetical protein